MGILKDNKAQWLFSSIKVNGAQLWSNSSEKIPSQVIMKHLYSLLYLLKQHNNSGKATWSTLVSLFNPTVQLYLRHFHVMIPQVALWGGSCSHQPKNDQPAAGHRTPGRKGVFVWAQQWLFNSSLQEGEGVAKTCAHQHPDMWEGWSADNSHVWLIITESQGEYRPITQLRFL